MRWVDFNEIGPPDNCPYISKSSKVGGYIYLCSPIGKELHITDCEQWQYVFKEKEDVEIRGEKLNFWLDTDFPEEEK